MIIEMDEMTRLPHLSEKQIFDLTRGLGDNDFIRSNYNKIWQILKNRLGLPNLVNFYAHCRLPDILYLQIGEDASDHSNSLIRPNVRIKQCNGLNRITIDDIGNSRMHLAVFENWQWLRKWASAVLSHFIDMPDSVTPQLLPSYEGSDSREIRYELQTLEDLCFRTPSQMTCRFSLQFPEAYIAFDSGLETLELKFIDENMGSPVFDIAKEIADQFPLVRVKYRIGKFELVLNQGWKEASVKCDSPTFLLPSQKNTDPLLWAANLVSDAEKKISTHDLVSAEAIVLDLRKRLVDFNRQQGLTGFPFIEIRERKLAVQESRHCSFCGTETSQVARVDVIFVVKHIAICDNPLCKIALDHYRESFTEVNKRIGNVLPIDIFHNAFEKAFSFKERVFGPIRDSVKSLFVSVFHRTTRIRPEDVVGKIDFKVQPFAFEPSTYEVETEVKINTREKDIMPFLNEHIKMSMIGSVSVALISIISLLIVQFLLWRYDSQWAWSIVIILFAFHVYISKKVPIAQTYLHCNSLLKIKPNLFLTLGYTVLTGMISYLVYKTTNLNFWCIFLILQQLLDCVKIQIIFTKARKELASRNQS